MEYAYFEFMTDATSEAVAKLPGMGVSAGMGARTITDLPSPPSAFDLQQDDLCQDFGHGSSRFYAATGSSSAAGFVRSKKASMAFAGIW